LKFFQAIQMLNDLLLLLIEFIYIRIE